MPTTLTIALSPVVAPPPERLASASGGAMTRHMLRERVRGQHARVTTLELFFDLVFVFAVTQLSHSLLAHLTLVGALQAALLMLAVWWAWIYTTWSTNWLDPDHP